MTAVRTAIEDQVLRITLDGPAVMNSLDPGTLDGLDAALDLAETDPTLRAVVITGTGKAFSVGMDLDFLGECFADPAGVFIPFTRRLHALLRRLEALPVPSIAVVNGLARAGGFELLLACDLVLAADEARVGDTHGDFGVVPGAGAAVRAIRKLGDQRARALMLTSRWLTGPEMVAWGLALESAPLAELDAALERLLQGMRGRSRPVQAAIRRVLNATPDLSVDQALMLEREEFVRFHEEVPDADEGYRAYVEGRRPSWGDAP